MVHAGELAPSGDNLQPWSFASKGDVLLIRYDSKRDTSLFNVGHLASFIALGAVLENVAVAATADGYRADIDIEPSNPERWSARVSFSLGAGPDPLSAVLIHRCTNRKPYSDQPLSAQNRAALDLSATFPDSRLIWVETKRSLVDLGGIVSRADRLIFENEHIHNHLFSTLRWTRSEVDRTRDGLPVTSLELGNLGTLAFRGLKKWPVVRFLNHFGFSAAAAGHSQVLMRRCAAAGLITVRNISPLGFVKAGRLFQRIWLQTTLSELALQPMTATIFLQLRSRLRDYTGLTGRQIRVVDSLCRDLQQFFSLSTNEVPAMLFRVGHAAPPSGRTIRRNISLEMS